MCEKFLTLSGPGGLLGNDDSDALSYWFVWNATRLFPVSGQPVILIGSPNFERACWHLSDGDFTIECDSHGPDHLYVKKAILSGKPLEIAWLRLDELVSSGTLRFTMSKKPSSFGSSPVPPSFPA